MERDIYNPPDAEVEASLKEQYEAATSGQRFANYIIDNIIFTLLGAVLIGVSMAIWPEIELFAADFGPGADYIIGVPPLLLLYIFFESLTGRTPGKLITRTKVVADDYGKASFGQVVLRTLIRIVPFEQFSFLNTECRGFHDSWSKTRVVKERAAAGKED